MGYNNCCPSRRETTAPATTTASGDGREGIHRSSTFAPFDDLLLAVIFVYLPPLRDGYSLRK